MSPAAFGPHDFVKRSRRYTRKLPLSTFSRLREGGNRGLLRNLLAGYGFAASAAVILFTACVTFAQPARADEILVAAAASLTDALRQIGRSYETNSKNKVSFTFGSSSVLARQIDEGAPADIFLSADLAQMDYLDRNRRLEPGTRRNLLTNQLVIVVPADSRLSIASPQDLLKPEVKRIALAEPTSVPAGVYSAAYLRSEGIWDRIKGKIVPVLDVRATLASVESGNVEAGFVYKTDAAISKKVRIAFEVPIDQGPRITYPVAIVKDTRHKAAARDFIRYLSGSAGKAVFQQYGFKVLDNTRSE